jgi:hypothetical protein
MGSLAAALTSGFHAGERVGGAFFQGQLAGTQQALAVAQIKDVNSLIEARKVQSAATKADAEFLKLFTDKISMAMGKAAQRESTARKDVSQLSALQGVDLLADESERLTQLLAQGQITNTDVMNQIELIAMGRSAAGGAAGPLPGETADGLPPSNPPPPIPGGGQRPPFPDPRVGLNIDGRIVGSIAGAGRFVGGALAGAGRFAGEALGNLDDLSGLAVRALFNTVPQSEVDQIFQNTGLLADALKERDFASELFQPRAARFSRPTELSDRFFNPGPPPLIGPLPPSLFDIPATAPFNP